MYNKKKHRDKSRNENISQLFEWYDHVQRIPPNYSSKQVTEYNRIRRKKSRKTNKEMKQIITKLTKKRSK